MPQCVGPGEGQLSNRQVWLLADDIAELARDGKTTAAAEAYAIVARAFEHYDWAYLIDNADKLEELGWAASYADEWKEYVGLHDGALEKLRERMPDMLR
jgi:hypothetical protein